MSTLRQQLIDETRDLLARLENEDIPLSAIESRPWVYPLRREVNIHRHLHELESQITSLRDELRQGAREPVRCAYSEDRGSYLHMLTGLPGGIAQDQKYIKKKSHSNEWMIITDPYFLQWDGPNKAFPSEKAYTEFIIDFIPISLKKLELFVLPGPNKRIFKKFNDRIRSRGTLVSYWQTTEIHDRTIIRDNNTGTLLGTSFGGYGNKLSFVLDIPDRDLEAFMSQLDRIRNA
ncbi:MULTISPECIES: hypothetical protein [unclassified Xanthomonas]|uniref:hypothetical protein n=1 Tax=Xanthomonas sp. LMG 9002 TaxID=1591158 RepID=UPI0013705CF6|nr:hypothetical protein [Xanthomonas sp. LMG 9002]